MCYRTDSAAHIAVPRLGPTQTIFSEGNCWICFQYTDYLSIHWVPLTTSSITMSTRLQYIASCLQRVRLQWASGFKTLGPTNSEFSYNEHLASIHWVLLTTSSVTTSIWLQYTGSRLQQVRLQWPVSFTSFDSLSAGPNFNHLSSVSFYFLLNLTFKF